jgi:hypothetical protein
MQKIKQRRYRAGTWQRILGRFEESGLTAPAFCAREGLSEQSLQRRRSRLGAGQGILTSGGYRRTPAVGKSGQFFSDSAMRVNSKSHQEPPQTLLFGLGAVLRRTLRCARRNRELRTVSL